MPIQVRVKDVGDGFIGYYGDKRKKVGEVFFINKESEFSAKWMERVSEHPTPSRKERAITGDPKTRQPAVRRAVQTGQATAQGDNATGSDSVPAGNAGGEGVLI